MNQEAENSSLAFETLPPGTIVNPPPGYQPLELELLTAEEVADLLKVTASFVYKLEKKKRIRSVRLGTRCVRFRPSDLAEFIASM